MALPRVPNGRRPLLHSLMVVLRQAERQGQRCGGTILPAGLVLGACVVELSSGPLGQTSRFSLEHAQQRGGEPGARRFRLRPWSEPWPAHAPN